MNLEAAGREADFVPHGYREQSVDLGEIRMNYAVTGNPESPPLLLIPGQTESWWGYEKAMPLLAEHFQVFAVDLRGQGRSSWTPGRYTWDIIGNDLVRFLHSVVDRPAYVSGLSSGGVLSAWLSAYAPPGQVLAAVYEDPPLFSSELVPEVGPGIRQGMGAVFELWSKWLGDQWSVGDFPGLGKAMGGLPPFVLQNLLAMNGIRPGDAHEEGIPQSLREYDPEWAKACVSGSMSGGCDHARMLSAVRTPVLFTHHFNRIDDVTGRLVGASTEQQVDRARQLIQEAGQHFTYRSFPDMPHSMHGADPGLFSSLVIEWVQSLG